MRCEKWAVTLKYLTGQSVMVGGRDPWRRDLHSQVSVVWTDLTWEHINMLKHCSTSSLSLIKSSSVSSSSESLLDFSPRRQTARQQGLVKVFTDKDTLANKMSYTTIMVDKFMTSRDVISRILTKMKMKCTDPDLYELYMAVETEEGEKTVKLEESSKLMELISCTPWTFRLILRAGNTIKLRVWDNISQSVLFRSILVSRLCTVGMATTILHQLYPTLERDSLVLFEECPELGFKRRLSEEEIPFKVMECWGVDSQFRFSLELRHINNNKMSSFSRGSSNVRTMDRKMLRFLRSFLENTEQSDGISRNDSLRGLEKSSVNSNSFLYIAF